MLIPLGFVRIEKFLCSTPFPPRSSLAASVEAVLPDAAEPACTYTDQKPP